MSEDWIAAEIARLRKTTELAGPARLGFELASQAYLDAHASAYRDKRLARPGAAAAWLRGEGKAICLTATTQRPKRAREQGERLG